MLHSPFASSVSTTPMDDESEVRYIARQPILDAANNLYAYELLFRGGNVQTCETSDPDAATISTIDVSLFLGRSSLTDGLPAFINCTREVLVDGTATTLPRDSYVLEVLESVLPDPQVLRALSDLKRLGYRIAIDDFDGDMSRDPLIAISDIIKVDFTLTNPVKRAEIAQRYLRRGHTLLAEKVETQEDFESARVTGYRLFQGFYFCRPTTITASDIRVLHPAYVSLMSAVYDPVFNVDAIDEAIRQEPSLCYRLLRYLNSAAFGVYPVRSIKHAIALLGQRELQKWISIVTAIAMAGPRSSELLSIALQRARFLESIAERAHAQFSSEFFLAGIFSLIDAMLNRELRSILPTLPLSNSVKDALTGRENDISETLRLVVSCERADWQDFAERCAAVKLPESEVWLLYEQARTWVREIRAQLE
jgi:c-di-GMP-related signal transduction protein